MKINKKLVSIIVLGIFLLTFSGLAIANEVASKDKEAFPVRQAQRLNAHECNAANCLQAVDQLVKENKLTAEEAKEIKEEIRGRRSENMAKRNAFRAERDKDRAARQGQGGHHMRMGYCRN